MMSFKRFLFANIGFFVLSISANASEQATFLNGKKYIKSNDVVWARNVIRSGGKVDFRNKILGAVRFENISGMQRAFISGYGNDAILRERGAYVDVGFSNNIYPTGYLFVVEAGRTTYVSNWVGKRSDIRAKPDPFMIHLVVNGSLRKVGTFAGMARVDLQKHMKMGEFATAVRVSAGTTKGGKLYGKNGGPDTTGAQIVGLFVTRDAMEERR